MRGDEALEVGDELAVPAGGELRVDSLPQRCQPQLLEARDLLLREGFVAEVGERVATEQRERGPQERGAPFGVALAPCLLEEALEPADVGLRSVAPQQIAAGARLDRVLPQQLAQRGDVTVERGERRLRRIAAPQRLDERIAGDGLVRVEQHQPQKGALLRPRGREVTTVVEDFEPAKDAKFQSGLIVAVVV